MSQYVEEVSYAAALTERLDDAGNRILDGNYRHGTLQRPTHSPLNRKPSLELPLVRARKQAERRTAIVGLSRNQCGRARPLTDEDNHFRWTVRTQGPPKLPLLLPLPCPSSARSTRQRSERIPAPETVRRSLSAALVSGAVGPPSACVIRENILQRLGPLTAPERPEKESDKKQMVLVLARRV